MNKLPQRLCLPLISSLIFLLLGGSLMLIKAQESLPDLMVESLTISQPNPLVGQPITITMQIKNSGPITVAGRRAYLYIDPPDQPPISTTSPTNELIVAGLSWPPGDAMIGQLGNYQFDTPGEHVIYAWVDPLERVAESDELNNLMALRITVNAEATPTSIPTDMPSATPTLVPSATIFPSATPTLTPSATIFPSVTPILTPSATIFPSVTPILTPSATIFPSATPTLIPSATPINMPSPTPELLPDVMVESLILSEPTLQVGQPVTITMQIKNSGSITVAGRRAYLYIDPPDQPPTSSTRPTSELIVAGIAWPPGDAMIGQLGDYQFDTPGEHVIYGWVDPLERLTELDETNNLLMIRVTVTRRGPSTIYLPLIVKPSSLPFEIPVPIRE